MKELPPYDTLQRRAMVATPEVLSELDSLASEVAVHSSLAREFFSRRPPGRPTWAEIEAWMRAPSGSDFARKTARDYARQVMLGQFQEAVQAAREAFMEAHPDRATRMGRPPGSSHEARRLALVGIVLGLLLEEGGERLRKRLNEESRSKEPVAA